MFGTAILNKGKMGTDHDKSPKEFLVTVGLSIMALQNYAAKIAEQVNKRRPAFRRRIFLVIYESVDLLGFWFEIKTCKKNNHRHVVDISRIIFLHNEGIGLKNSKSTGS